MRVDAVLELGAPVVLHLPDPSKPGETFETHERISVIDPPHHLQYNTGDEHPRRARDPRPVGRGPRRAALRATAPPTCSRGEHAKPIFDMQAEWVTNGFNATAHALKARAEQLWAAR